MQTSTPDDIDHDTPTTSPIYTFRWYTPGDGDPHAPGHHLHGTEEEARELAHTYDTRITLLHATGFEVMTVGDELSH